LASISSTRDFSFGKKSHRRALLALGACLLAGCANLATLAPPVTPALVARSYGDASMLASGRGIYLTQCTACHAPESVPAHAGKWPGLIREMAPKSRLTAAEERAVLAYVLAAEHAQ